MSGTESDVSTVRLSFQHFSWIDYSIFVIMLGVCGGIGIYFGFIKKQTSTKDYLMGGRNMKLVPICFSLVASFISGISLLGIPTEIYLYGSSYIFTMIGAFMMCIVITTTFIPVLHELQLTSAYEMAWLPIVIYVPALAFNQVTGVNIHIVSPIVCLVCIFYTCVGGLKAVVWTDVIQTVVMIGAMLLVIIKGTVIVGGVDEVFSRNWATNRLEFPSCNLDLTERHSVWSVTIGSTFYWIGNIAVNQSMMQRFLALSNVKMSIRAVWGFFSGVILIVSICSYSGLLAYARFNECDPLNSKLVLAKDQLLPLLVMDVLAEWKGMPGIFVAGVFSAALSSLSTGLNSMAAVVLEDFWKPFFHKLSQKQTQILVRSVVVVLGCICVGLVFVVEKLGSVLQLTMSLSSASMGPLAGIFLMGLFLPFIDGVGALTGGIAGLITAWWVAAQSQLAQARGLLTFVEKERHTFNCTYNFEPMTILEDITEGEVSYIYRISYLWFTGLGCSVTVIVACLVSLRSSKNKIDPRLFAPFLRSWLTHKYEVEHMDLKSTPS
ncbi:sodium-coupled monocarboxylate transporter 1-like isoform X2 [Vanessa atalanta]|uniref:sodium-coupled monocarboxylate transporter 1-like isoform X2 n=1 Tax=Vanessa atalanta TaxID=42275 RepID=UPI001FCDD794|nr:sodium-coupled monocarboxylate transporter 1-like isoform X2 [Vanessa atalanta]